jgi:hypothetical protein
MVRFADFLTNPDLIERVEKLFGVTFADSLLGEAAPGALLYHKDIGVPAGISGPPVGMTLTYGAHARQAAIDDGLTAAPRRLPNHELIEVEVVNGRATKWVVRFPLKDDSRVTSCWSSGLMDMCERCG